MENHHQASTRRSASPFPPPPSPPLSPESAAAEALANARWTPTKEQVTVLEGLYREGMRTPTAEQIQQMTARLREHGPIEGKNIFYWFQNHKARQRQRQKQQTFDYFARQFHRPQPLPILHRAPAFNFPHAAAPPPSQTMTKQAAPPQQAAACNREVMYRQQQEPQQQPPQQQWQRYMTGHAASHAAYYPQTQQPLQYPRMDMRRDNVPAQQTTPGAVYYHPGWTSAGTQQQQRVLHSSPATVGHRKANARPVQPQTLNLFPMYPTFVTPEKKKRRPSTASSVMPSASASFSWEAESSGSHSGESSVPFFDFFSLNSGGR